MMRSIIAAGVALAAVALAPLAQADSGSHDYYQYLVSQGVIGSIQGGYSAETVVADGNYACGAFQQGTSDASVVDHLDSQMSTAQAQSIVYAAHRFLCP